MKTEAFSLTVKASDGEEFDITVLIEGDKLQILSKNELPGSFNKEELTELIKDTFGFRTNNARGVAIFAKACFGHPSPSKRQKLNATANAFGAPDVLRTCHFATTIVNSVLAS